MLRFNIMPFLMLISFLVSALFTSCVQEDDIPPVSAYVEPPPPEPGENIIEAPVFSEVPVDFETSNPEFESFGELNGDVIITVVENPVSGGINTSGKVVEVKYLAGTEPWAGFFFDLAEKVDFSVNRTIKIKVYSPEVGQNITLKLEDIEDANVNKEIQALTTVANEWEELSFIFSPGDDAKFDKAVLFFNFLGDKDADVTHYFDDIVLVEGDDTGGGNDEAPTSAAPAPILPEAEVISIYSDAYTPITVSELPTEWSGSGFEEVQIEGNNTIRYFDLDFTGIVTDYGNPTDLSSKSFVHFDYWTSDGTEFGIKLVNTTYGDGDPLKEDLQSVGTVSQGQWVSVDIPLDDFAFDRSGVTQILFDNLAAEKITLFIDNLYFHNGQPNMPLTAAPAPTFDAANVISIYSDAYTPITVSELPTEWSGSGFEEVQIEGNNTIKYFDLDFTGIVTDYGNPTDLTTMTHVHFDYWTFDGVELGIKLVNTTYGDGDPLKEDLQSVGTVSQGQWVSVDIPLDDFAFDRSGVTQILLDNLVVDDASITVYIDNLFFYNDPTTPNTAAPAPTVDAANVISIYSDAYTPITVSELPTEWSGSGFEEVQIEGNNTIKYFDLDFTGIVTDYGNPTDLTAMTHVHFDYWTFDGVELGIKLVNTTYDPIQEDLESVGTVTQGQWVSVDIPLDDFAFDRSGVTQILFDNLVVDDASITVYIDNLYFYK